MAYIIKQKGADLYFEATRMYSSMSDGIERWAEKMPFYTENISLAKHFETLTEAEKCMGREIFFPEYNEIVETKS